MTQQSHSEETKIKRDTYIPLFIASLLTIARTWKQPRCPLTDEWIKQFWYIYTMEYYSAIDRNTYESVLTRWMNLEPIIQSEVSQKEKDKSRILTHIYRIQKMVLKNLQGSNGQTILENTLMDIRKGEQWVRCMERVTQKLTLLNIKQIANGNLLYGSGNSNRGSVSTQREGDGREMEGSFKREGIYVYLWLIQPMVKV